MDILVSINCITYNHEEYIAEALDSFLMQKTNFKYEILIHDDASTDRTQQIIEEYKKKYPDIIKPILQKDNQQSKGVKKISYRFNNTRAKGKYIAICEGDDYWTDPYKLQKQIDYLEGNPECTMCFHAAEIINSNKKVKTTMRPYNNNKICSIEDIIIGGGGFCPTQAIIYRKYCMDNPPELYFKAPVGDYPLQMIVSSQGYAYYINEVMSVYRKVMSNGSSWSNSNKSVEKNKKLYKELNYMLDEFDKYSNQKYNFAVNRAKLINNFYALVLDQKIKEIRKNEYQAYFSSLNVTEKFKIYFRCFLPNLYVKLTEFKYK